MRAVSPLLRLALAFGLCALPCAAFRRLATGPKDDEYGLRCMHFDQESMQERVTAIVSTSPRVEDETGQGLEVIKHTIRSIREVLGFNRSQIVVAWDALPEAADKAEGAEVLDSNTSMHYKGKLESFQRWNREELDNQAIVFQNTEWTHQAEMLRRVFNFLGEQKRLTPLVYMVQDDSPVTGRIDVPPILEKLSCDPQVDYVRFLWSPDCTVGRAVSWNTPCETHPDAKWLQSTERMSDRPHFATTHFYYSEIFRRCPPEFRGSPEYCAPGIKHGWLYGERHSMLHEANELRDSYNELPKPEKP